MQKTDNLAKFRYVLGIIGALMSILVIFSFLPIYVLDPISTILFAFMRYIFPLGLITVPIVSGTIYFAIGHLIYIILQKEGYTKILFMALLFIIVFLWVVLVGLFNGPSNVTINL